MSKIFLKGIGIQGFRSFGPEPQYFAPFSGVNLLAGRNNSGKSNVLRVIRGLATLKQARDSRQATQQQNLSADFVNRHVGPAPANLRVFLPIFLDQDSVTQEAEEIARNFSRELPQIQDIWKRLIEGLPARDGVSWFEYDPIRKMEPVKPVTADFLDPKTHQLKIVTNHEWHLIWSKIANATGGGPNDWVPPVISRLSPWNRTSLPEAYEIGPFRQVGAKGGAFEGFSERGLINDLAALESPAHENLGDKKRFTVINEFVQDVLENRTAKIQIPHDRKTIHVEIDGKALPIELLGTGIHEVVILAAAATTIVESILCIEEPEIHLHPRLQRKLIDYLHKKTSNQYFITTHSASLLDSRDTSTFHVWNEDGVTKAVASISPGSKALICFDLGYRASDLMQANCIIWVEGPSDRIYLTHWLSQVAPSLKEGIDYSVMHYGGRLLSHLTANDPEIDEFISLRRLNRHVAVVMDSDKTSKAARINATKARIRDEIESNGGLIWITKGREIENYVKPGEIEHAIKQLYGRDVKVRKQDLYDQVYMYAKGKRRELQTPDKVKLARTVCNLGAKVDFLDLRERIRSLAKFIEHANSH